MTHQIQVSDDLYDLLSNIAAQRGRPVKQGPGGGMSALLREMADAFAPIAGADGDEIMMRFNARIMPAINELMIAMIAHGESIETNFSTERGLHVRRVREPVVEA